MRAIVMGPSGSGKSTVGAALAARLGGRFLDADDLHPSANVAKMASGVPLEDADRMPWLDRVGSALADADGPVLIACSALARRYRDRIRSHAGDVVFVELVVPEGELARRMSDRAHFMPPGLLGSQIAILEPLGADEAGIRVDNTGDLTAVVERAVEALRDAQSLR